MKKLSVFATHPIQYQVPLFRALHALDSYDVELAYLSDHSISGGQDKGFGQSVVWDVPMLEGFKSVQLINRGKGNLGSGFFAYCAKGIRDYIRARKPEVILVPGHSVAFYWQVVYEASKYQIPVIVRPESLDGSNIQRSASKAFLRKQLLKFFYSRITAFCTTGTYASADAKSHGFDDEQIFWSPYCIDTGHFQASINAARDRDAEQGTVSAKDGRLHFIFVGKFIDWKAPELLIKAFAQMPQMLREKAALSFVGSGPTMDATVALAQDLLSEAEYTFHGFINQQDLPSYYLKSDVFVIPSKRGHESWGLVVNEAMTCGLAIIASDGVGSRSDLVLEGQNGFIFEADRAEKLAECMQKCVVDARLVETFGIKSKEIIKNYSSSEAIHGLSDAVEFCLAKSLSE